MSTSGPKKSVSFAWRMPPLANNDCLSQHDAEHLELLIFLAQSPPVVAYTKKQWRVKVGKK